MGDLDGRNYTVTGVSYRIRSQSSGARFTVPKAIAQQLGSGDDRPIGLRVEVSGRTLFDGVVRLASGTEAYYRLSDPTTGGLDTIPAAEDLEVTATRAT